MHIACHVTLFLTSSGVKHPSILSHLQQRIVFFMFVSAFTQNEAHTSLRHYYRYWQTLHTQKLRDHHSAISSLASHCMPWPWMIRPTQSSLTVMSCCPSEYQLMTFRRASIMPHATKASTPVNDKKNISKDDNRSSCHFSKRSFLRPLW